MAYPLFPLLAAICLTYVTAIMTAGLLARTGFPIPDQSRRIGHVDGLRGYLALSVLCHHFIIWMQATRLHGTWSEPTINVFNNLGAGGVALFFMVTGLVFYPRILNGFSGNSWFNIYVGRFFRIVPLVAVSVILILAIISFRTGFGAHGSLIRPALMWVTALGQPDLLGYQDSGKINAYVLWSLKYEWVFYLLLLPLLALIVETTRARVPSWFVPAGLLMVSLAARRLHLDYAVLQYLPLFAIGMLAFELRRIVQVRELLSKRWMAVPALACLLAGLISAPNPYGTMQLVLFSAFFVCVVCDNDLFCVLSTRAALILGDCSFSIYVLHGILLALLFDDGAMMLARLSTEQLPILLPIAAAVVAIVTPMTYLFIERPAMELGKGLSRFILRPKLREQPIWAASPALESIATGRTIGGL